MDDKSIFRVKYPGGEMQVNIATFFGAQEARKIKKLLQFAAKHCSDEQRKELSEALHRGIRRRKEAVDSIKVLEIQKIEIADPFLEHRSLPSVSSQEREITKQIAKIKKSIEILEEVWPS